MIREATIDDISALVRMGEGFHAEALADKGLGFKVPDFIQHCVMLMELPLTALFVAEGEDGALVGSIAGMLSAWILSFDQVMITEQWWWVDKDKRGGKIALELEEALLNWGKERGATKISMIAIASEREKSVRRYYERKGHKYLETHFIKEI